MTQLMTDELIAAINGRNFCSKYVICELTVVYQW